jgi:GNAT superfamily N-acetyltransferase
MRAATPADDNSVVALLSRTLGWSDDDRHHQLFAWKHRKNPFGPSPGWVAEDGEGILGFRTFMRWRFRSDDGAVAAVRAVDTATDPRAQGRGVFRALTMQAVRELTASGCDWVFNTPNNRSAPGYLSMGWQKVGRMPLSIRPRTWSAFPRLVGARQPAELWSAPTTAGEDVHSVLGDRQAVEQLVDETPREHRLHTDWTVEYLTWRYTAGPVVYRAFLSGRDLRDGVIFFRLRRRGLATEAVIAEMLGPSSSKRNRGAACGRILRSSGADYAVGIGSSRPLTVVVPNAGPLLTWRALAKDDRPELRNWDVSTGDIELF